MANDSVFVFVIVTALATIVTALLASHAQMKSVDGSPHGS